MKLNALAACLLFAGLAAVSCIKDEAPNSEADIESCTLPGDVLNRDPVIENDKVTLHLKKGTDLSSLSPEFTLTPGATISPASGTTRDFTSLQTYEVTSEDGRWKKRYRIEATTSGLTTRTNCKKVGCDRTDSLEGFLSHIQSVNNVVLYILPKALSFSVLKFRYDFATESLAVG